MVDVCFVPNITMMQCVTRRQFSHIHLEEFKQAFENISLLRSLGCQIRVSGQIFDKVKKNLSLPQNVLKLKESIDLDETTRGTTGYTPENAHKEIAERMSLSGFVIVIQDATAPPTDRIVYLTPDIFNKRTAFLFKLKSQSSNRETDLFSLLYLVFFSDFCKFLD